MGTHPAARRKTVHGNLCDARPSWKRHAPPGTNPACGTPPDGTAASLAVARGAEASGERNLKIACHRAAPRPVRTAALEKVGTGNLCVLSEENGQNLWARAHRGRPPERRSRHHRQMDSAFDELERTPGAPERVDTRKSRRCSTKVGATKKRRLFTSHSGA